MLFTRCPDCHTTFRVTDELLRKAGGQVRCGRCACVFDAHTDLREEEPGETGAAAQDDSAASGGRAAGHVEHVVLETAPGPQAPGTRERTDKAPLPAHSDEPLRAQRSDEDETRSLAAWAHIARHALPPPSARFWLSAAAIAGGLLVAQMVNHERATLAAQPVIGPMIRGVYAVFGESIIPLWDIDQYELVDWVATAQPASGGSGDLLIKAHIHNRGPRAQPYPQIELRLLDRWEASIGSRVFGPGEYLSQRSAENDLMQAGATAEAQLAVVHPDAYGFELDVCIETESLLNCAGDGVFR
jgi:predicted Zn finger-like uncharacterized protein